VFKHNIVTDSGCTQPDNFGNTDVVTTSLERAMTQIPLSETPGEMYISDCSLKPKVERNEENTRRFPSFSASGNLPTWNSRELCEDS